MPGAVVADDAGGEAVFRARADDHAAAGGVPEGIAEQVLEDLYPRPLQALRVVRISPGERTLPERRLALPPRRSFSCPAGSEKLNWLDPGLMLTASHTFDDWTVIALRTAATLASRARGAKVPGSALRCPRTRHRRLAGFNRSPPGRSNSQRSRLYTPAEVSARDRITLSDTRRPAELRFG
jgi:hypothetical protein